jgi:hypothetical protein
MHKHKKHLLFSLYSICFIVMNSFLMDPERFDTAISLAETAAGIMLDPRTVSHTETPTGTDVAGQDKTGFVDARFTIHYNNTNKKAVPLTDFDTTKEYLFNGLLQRRTGTFEIGQVALEHNTFFEGKQYVEARLLNSPRAINMAQVALGRHPGRDAFYISREKNRKTYTDGEWLEGVAYMKIKAADTSHWSISSHDGDPYQHIQSWILTPPSICVAIAKQARSLIGKHGDNIHLPKEELPTEVATFTSKLENLHWYTRALMKSLDQDNFGLSPTAKSITNQVVNEFFQTELAAYITTRDLFSAIGANGPNQKVSQRTMEKIGAEYVTHAAGILLRADQVLQTGNAPTPFTMHRTISATTIDNMRVFDLAA